MFTGHLSRTWPGKIDRVSVFVDVLSSSSINNGPVIKPPRQMGFGHLGRYSLGAEEVTPPLSWGVSSYPRESDSSSEKTRTVP